jgi:hypothetical protein
MSRRLFPIAAALAALFLLGIFSGEIFDPDYWFHLKTGQCTVASRALCVPDRFSYTTAGAKPGYPGEAQTQRFNLTHEWLAQVAMYLVYLAGGFPLSVALRALLIAGACLMTGLIARRRTNSRWWGLMAALAASSVAYMFATDRPTLVSYLFTMLFIASLEWRRALWILPLLAIVWANCHGGFFLAWVVCGAYCVEAFVRRLPDARRLAILSAVTALLSGLNPNGFAIIPTLLRYRESYMTAANLEWRHADLWGEPYGYNLLLYASVPLLLLAWRRVRPADWMLFAFFAYSSLTAFRNEIYIGLYAPVLIASYFPWKWRAPLAARYAAVAALAIAVVAGAMRGPFFQFRAGEWRYPAGAANFLAANHITAPLFNTYLIGGYLIWKGQRVFIDGRSLSETVFKDYQTIVYSPPGTPVRRELLARYGVGAIVMDSFEYLSGDLYPLNRAMAYPDMAGWKLVYEDPQSLVFLRDVPPGMPVLPADRIADHLENQCRMLVERDPKYPGCARRLGFLVRLTNPARARRMFALYLQHESSDAEARAAYEELTR